MQFIDLKSRHQLIGDKINTRIQKVMNHGQFILGPEVRELEEKLAKYTGSKHCVTVSSGTDSLLVALMALGVGAGDEVITVPYTWISTAEVMALLGAKPVFVDIRSDTWNMDESQLETSITEKLKPLCLYPFTVNVRIWMPSMKLPKSIVCPLLKMLLKVLELLTKVKNHVIYLLLVALPSSPLNPWVVMVMVEPSLPMTMK